VFETNAFDLANLEEEHDEIRRRYAGLEKTILRGLGQARILEAANSLVEMMLLHFTHEDQFLVKPSFSKFQQRHRDANIEVTAQLFGIETGLAQGKIATVFQLLLLGRVWIKEHMHLEQDEFECETLIPARSPFLVRSAIPGRTKGHDHLRHAHLREQPSLHSAPELNG
jgi:hemerythrin